MTFMPGRHCSMPRQGNRFAQVSGSSIVFLSLHSSIFWEQRLGGLRVEMPNFLELVVPTIYPLPLIPWPSKVWRQTTRMKNLVQTSPSWNYKYKSGYPPHPRWIFLMCLSMLSHSASITLQPFHVHLYLVVGGFTSSRITCQQHKDCKI